MHQETVAAGFASALLALLTSKGLNADSLLDKCEINPEILAKPDNRMPLKQFIYLMEMGKELTNEPALALHYGEMSTVPASSIVYLICASADSVIDAFHQMNRYSRLVIDSNDMETTISSDETGTWLELQSPIYFEYPQLVESGLARIVTGSASYFADRPFAKAIHVSFPEPSYLNEYQRIFDVPITFNCERNAILFDQEFLSLELPNSNQYLFDVLCERADTLLQQLDSEQTIQGKIQKLLLPKLHVGIPEMQQIADQLGMSKQSLYRKLKAQGSGYDQLVDALRHKMALQYLNGKKVSVKETAYLLGFSDPGSFSRAFKRWTGSRPSQIEQT